MSDVLIIVVTYNAEKWVEKCFGSIFNSDLPADAFVVDNGSTDGTLALIREHFPLVEIVETGENLGFGAANNIGLKAALERGYKYAYLLNQDAWLEKDTLAKLANASASNGEFGILSPLQLSANGEYDKNFSKRCGKYLKEAENDEKILAGAVVEVPFVMAAHWMIRRDALEAVGGFSPAFKQYGEDDNYLDRLHFHGYKCGVLPSATAVHDRGDRHGTREQKMKRKWVTAVFKVCNPNRPFWLNAILEPLELIAMSVKNLSPIPMRYIPTLIARYKELKVLRRISMSKGAFLRNISDEKIYVLHEFGAPSHYIALECLARKNGMEVAYREFRVFQQFKVWAKHPQRYKDFPRRIVINIYFLVSLPFRKPCKVVIGIAPYNRSVGTIMSLLRRHEVYYHTSYSCWDGSRSQYAPKNERTMQLWREFVEHYVKHIFAVSEKTKSELIKNGLSSEDRISIVNHSYREKIEVEAKCPMTKTFIYCGRMVKEKGIEELLQYFSKHRDCTLILIGRGEEDSLVKEYARNYENIVYKGYISGLQNIIPFYMKSSFMLLNSHRTASWEELFGITLIEGMACGCVPIATNHAGPKEIISDHVDGIICEEGDISKAIDEVLGFDDVQYQEFRSRAIETGSRYFCENMADRWKAVLE